MGSNPAQERICCTIRLALLLGDHRCPLMCQLVRIAMSGLYYFYQLHPLDFLIDLELLKDSLCISVCNASIGIMFWTPASCSSPSKASASSSSSTGCEDDALILD
ncbi:hypothetical protein M9H77_02225 [Catharanthus roseus]|uniref:Uncharacterized protein n=1 Tax=Catharanthus roseus TaxID=4058 RepID=A0ACC0C8A3_CATRO|nr:hypothetical protein M9H77_02225 [Catharanthus roseus]